MKRSTKLALLSAGLGIASVGAVATTAVRAATSTTSTTSTTTPTTNDSSPPSRGQNLTEEAKLLGITTSQLQSELNAGKQFYQIAAEHGVTYDKLKASAQATYQAKLNDMVKVGYLTQTEANTFLQQWINNAATSPLINLGFVGPGHGHMKL